MVFNVNDKVVVDSPPSVYHGMTATIVSMDQYGVMLTFSKEECAKVPNGRKVTVNRPIPFDEGTFVAPGSPIRPQWQPYPGAPKITEMENCPCVVFGPPCMECGLCQVCNKRIKGSCYDSHAWRHYVGSEEYNDITALNNRERFPAPAPTPTALPDPFGFVPMQHSVFDC